MPNKPYGVSDIEDWLALPDDFLLRVTKVATILDRSKRRIRQMVTRNVLRAVRSEEARNIYIQVGEVKRYIAAHKKGRKP